MEDFYKRQDVLFTILRDDGMRCCCKCPCKWLDTFVCFNCCRDGVHIYSGSIPIDPTVELGRPTKNEQTSKLLGSAIQPVFGGCCTPLFIYVEKVRVTMPSRSEKSRGRVSSAAAWSSAATSSSSSPTTNPPSENSVYCVLSFYSNSNAAALSIAQSVWRSGSNHQAETTKLGFRHCRVHE